MRGYLGHAPNHPQGLHRCPNFRSDVSAFAGDPTTGQDRSFDVCVAREHHYPETALHIGATTVT